jgi:hypothetical protein
MGVGTYFGLHARKLSEESVRLRQQRLLRTPSSRGSTRSRRAAGRRWPSSPAGAGGGWRDLFVLGRSKESGGGLQVAATDPGTAALSSWRVGFALPHDDRWAGHPGDRLLRLVAGLGCSGSGSSSRPIASAAPAATRGRLAPAWRDTGTGGTAGDGTGGSAGDTGTAAGATPAPAVRPGAGTGGTGGNTGTGSTGGNTGTGGTGGSAGAPAQAAPGKHRNGRRRGRYRHG